jgi:hypothetical protein
VNAIIGRFATSMRPNPCRSHSSTHRREPVVRADHPPADVFGIAEAAECHGFQLGRTGTSGQFQCDRVFSRAALEVASRKTQIAVQKMNAGLLGGEMMLLGCGLGRLKIGLRSCKIIRHALHCGEPDPRQATFPIIGGRIQGCLVGAPGLRHGAEIVQDFTVEERQCKTVGLVGGQREAALDQP